MSTPLWAQSATTLAKMIRSKEVSSREVVSAHLDRIEAVNGQVRAITAVLADSALAAADAADRTEPQGPLHGVPFSIKENIDCMGSATTQGLPAMRDAIPTVDGPTVERMKAAGAIPLARTNLPEMGLRIDTENPLHGRTFNPWNPAVAVGGSSGGEGAALATGMSPLGLGNDIGGSLRNPAFCCGITSIKATPGRIPWALSLVPAEQTVAYGLMISEGPMARTVADVKAAYEVLVGWHPRDPFSVDAGLGAFPPVPKRVALVTEVPGVALPKAFIEAVERAGAVLAEAGWEVVSAVPPETPPGPRGLGLSSSGRCAAQFPHARSGNESAGRGHAREARRALPRRSDGLRCCASGALPTDAALVDFLSRNALGDWPRLDRLPLSHRR